MTNIFENATRTKLRFASARGELSVEQLWDVPLRSQDLFNLNAIAVNVNKILRDLSEESFVETKKTAAQARYEAALEVVKHVIDVKLAEEEAKSRSAKKREKEKLLAILAEKQDGKLSELSERELQRRIAALE